MSTKSIANVAWINREEYISKDPVEDIVALLEDAKKELFFIPGPKTVEVVKKINRYIKDN